jgi:hypothetical protein
MKKLLVLLSVLTLQTIVSAGTVHAEWTSWTGYTVGGGVYVSPDAWHASDPSLLSIGDAPDAWINTSSVLYVGVLDGRQDVLIMTDKGSFGMDFFLPNYRDTSADSLKEIRMEITYKSFGDSAFIFNVEPVYSDPTLIADVYGAYLEERVQLANGWMRDVYSFLLFPNCEWEFIDLGFNAKSAVVAVDSVVIDTVCIPEPATLAILILGSAMLVKTRRRAA